MVNAVEKSIEASAPIIANKPRVNEPLENIILKPNGLHIVKIFFLSSTIRVTTVMREKKAGEQAKKSK